MTTTINASNSGSGGLIQTADASGVLALQTAGTTALTLSATQNATFAGTLTTAAKGIAATSLPAGAVLQIVSSTLNASASTSSTSYVASTLIATITPTSATNKILIFLNGGSVDSTTSGNSIQTSMYRNIAGAGYSSLSFMQTIYFSSSNNMAGHTFNYLDSPATTSSISYQPYFKMVNGGTVFFNNNGAMSLTLLEIAA